MPDTAEHLFLVSQIRQCTVEREVPKAIQGGVKHSPLRVRNLPPLQVAMGIPGAPPTTVEQHNKVVPDEQEYSAVLKPAGGWGAGTAVADIAYSVVRRRRVGQDDDGFIVLIVWILGRADKMEFLNGMEVLLFGSLCLCTRSDKEKRLFLSRRKIWEKKRKDDVDILILDPAALTFSVKGRR